MKDLQTFKGHQLLPKKVLCCSWGIKKINICGSLLVKPGSDWFLEIKRKGFYPNLSGSEGRQLRSVCKTASQDRWSLIPLPKQLKEILKKRWLRVLRQSINNMSCESPCLWTRWVRFRVDRLCCVFYPKLLFALWDKILPIFLDSDPLNIYISRSLKRIFFYLSYLWKMVVLGLWHRSYQKCKMMSWLLSSIYKNALYNTLTALGIVVQAKLNGAF